MMAHRVFLAFLLFGLVACGDRGITSSCLFPLCGGDVPGPSPHRFIVSGTVNMAGAPAAARLKLTAAAAGTVLSTTSSSAQDGRYDETGVCRPGAFLLLGRVDSNHQLPG